MSRDDILDIIKSNTPNNNIATYNYSLVDVMNIVEDTLTREGYTAQRDVTDPRANIEWIKPCR